MRTRPRFDGWRLVGGVLFDESQINERSLIASRPFGITFQLTGTAATQ